MSTNFHSERMGDGASRKRETGRYVYVYAYDDNHDAYL